MQLAPHPLSSPWKARILPQAGDLTVAIGSFSLLVSVGYFIYDGIVIVVLQSEPFYPLLAHHVLGGAAVTFIAFARPRAVWYACLVQCSEGAIPPTFFVWLLEQRGASVARPTLLYTIARWVKLTLWLLLRVLLFGVYGSAVVRDWASMDGATRGLGAVMGSFFLVFNLGGLVTNVLPGFPWLRPRLDPGKGKEQ